LDQSYGGTIKKELNIKIISENKYMGNRILVIAPHPDDDILGCGGIIKKYTLAGDEVYVLVVTRGTPKFYSDEKIETVRKEALQAHAILGVSKTIFLDFHAPYLDIVSLADIASEISRNIEFFKIDTLYVPHWGDIHHDHKAVFNAGLVAARPVGGSLVRNIYSYETLSETEWSAPIGDEVFVPTRYVNITEVVDSKLEALKCFKSQLKEFPNPRSLKAIESLSNYRGSTVGFKNAEAFMTIRVIED
jgi:LmbE family N-acetylglucosaminyl deacetylase